MPTSDNSRRDRAAQELLEQLKVALVAEYESTGQLALASLLRSYPHLAEDLTEFALWLHGTERRHDVTGVWADDDGVAAASLKNSAASVGLQQKRPSARSTTRWTNPSVRALAGEEDPIEAITNKARALVMHAFDQGWAGPPFDPVQLAEIRGIRVIGSMDVRDARLVPTGGHAFQIEFNPNRPIARVRYSLAHEIAHTLFPDCGERIRNRVEHKETKDDEWQLEALCNIAAAELLMPFGTLPRLEGEKLAIENLIEMRKAFAVSAEAMLIRVARLATEPCLAFCATRLEIGRHAGRYRLDYTIASPGWKGFAPRSIMLPPGTGLRDCQAIGYTAKSLEDWPSNIGSVYLECVGVAPYPGLSHPRAVGLARPLDAVSLEDPITYLIGDATEPRGTGQKIVAHIVNDATPRWGGGFALAIRQKWPQVQDDFIAYVAADRARLRLGCTHFFRIDESCSIVHMVAQKGYGPSPTPRIRYAALAKGLEQLAAIARENRASVHVPRIGAGQAGGSWPVIVEMLLDSLCAEGIRVFVYDRPEQQLTPHPQLSMGL